MRAKKRMDMHASTVERYSKYSISCSDIREYILERNHISVNFVTSGLLGETQCGITKLFIWIYNLFNNSKKRSCCLDTRKYILERNHTNVNFVTSGLPGVHNEISSSYSYGYKICLTERDFINVSFAKSGLPGERGNLSAHTDV